MSKRILGPLAAACSSLATALLCEHVLHSNATIAALFLLLDVVLIGAYASRAEAIAASLIATLSLDYFFIPPFGKISIAEPQGWLALAVFLAVSVVATNLSARLRRQRDELAASQVETEKLHALNRAILLNAGGPEEVQRILLNKCMELFNFTEAALFETATGTVHRSDQNGNIAEADLRRVAHYGSIESNDKLTGIPITLGNKFTVALLLSVRRSRSVCCKGLATPSLSHWPKPKPGKPPIAPKPFAVAKS